jgi:Uma2 family endonuclease
MPVTAPPRSREEQAALNQHRWREVLFDPALADLPDRIETDRDGNLVMSPPPAPLHGNRQIEIGYWLRQLLPQGRTISECPLSTSDGVKAVDVCWLAPGREAEVETVGCLLRTPEICVEIWSPSNRPGAIERKRELYFEAGAREVWVCGLDGSMHFHGLPGGSRLTRSELCPAFPGAVLPSRLKET